MLIPSIDLMGGKIVQLVQGEKKALEFDDFNEWVDRFSKYPIVQLIDLDAAMGKGNNFKLIEHFAAQLPVQVGGGVRNVESARAMFAAGAKKIIIGSSLYSEAGVNVEIAAQMASEFTAGSLIFAIDSRGGKIAIHGWKKVLAITAEQAIRALDGYCGGFLYTHIDTEGMMAGFPMAVAQDLRKLTARKLIVAGGVKTQQEVDDLHALGIDSVVGMAIYTGAMQA
ncbi:MAG TPA: HisA/HisF-related TIM barrel protein [Candidatus Saccharimonadales bacterium]|jgi:phosphoribosylformimino-5-aminoimidazole carboxamide ribotide isomerase|nr:HisA/HisF-related TIM barrel protein [Candidatus Saccharimonadales bacterium]